jgi:hypothetical protein
MAAFDQDAVPKTSFVTQAQTPLGLDLDDLVAAH